MNLCNENNLQTLDDYWRDLERSVYPDTPPLVKTEFRRLFYAGAMTVMTMYDKMMEGTATETEITQQLKALHGELHRFANLGQDESKAPPPEGEGP